MSCPANYEHSHEIFPRVMFQLDCFEKTGLEDFLAFLIEYHKDIIPVIEPVLIDYLNQVKIDENIKNVNKEYLEALL